MSDGHHCQTPGEIPKGEHYAIIESASYYEADLWDERAASTPVAYVKYFSFDNRDDWIRRIEDLTKDKSTKAPSFVAMHVKPAVVTINVSVGVS